MLMQVLRTKLKEIQGRNFWKELSVDMIRSIIEIARENLNKNFYLNKILISIFFKSKKNNSNRKIT